MKVNMQPSELREQGRNAYPDPVNPYDWREDRCAYVNWQEGFTQAKYAADWARRECSQVESGDRA